MHASSFSQKVLCSLVKVASLKNTGAKVARLRRPGTTALMNIRGSVGLTSPVYEEIYLIIAIKLPYIIKPAINFI